MKLPGTKVLLLLVVTIFTLLSVGCTSGGSDLDQTTPNPSSIAFTNVNYGDLLLNPRAYKGCKVSIIGQVFTQPEERSDGTWFQMYVDPADLGWTAEVGIHGNLQALNVEVGNIVRVEGKVLGEVNRKDEYGSEVLAVGVLATYVGTPEEQAGTTGRDISTPEKAILGHWIAYGASEDYILEEIIIDEQQVKFVICYEPEPSIWYGPYTVTDAKDTHLVIEASFSDNMKRKWVIDFYPELNELECKEYVGTSISSTSSEYLQTLTWKYTGGQ